MVNRVHSAIVALVSIALLAVFPVQQASSSEAEFHVADIRVAGLRRVSAGTVFATIQINAGDRVDANQLQNAVRALYATGYFDDVTVSRDEDTLLFFLNERAFVGEIIIDGNSAISTDNLLDALDGAGLAQGRPFERSTLESMGRELERQYVAQGRYNASVETSANITDRNLVEVSILIDEGKVSRIVHINFIGNEKFDDETLRDQLGLQKRSLGTIFTNADKYSREQLQTDLEELRSFYLDKGYLRFRVTDVNVSFDPVGSEVYLGISVYEGDTYEVSSISIVGELPFNRETFVDALEDQSGFVFSQEQISNTELAFTSLLSNSGYAFAQVSTYTEANDDDRTVEVIYNIDPGPVVYVRRINFRGNDFTQDSALRRELRQMEGAWASDQLIEFSKFRLQRLPFLASVDISKTPVVGADDLIDIDIDVQEQLSGSFLIELGYSSDFGTQLGLQVQQSNFLGGGNAVSFGVQRSNFQEELSVNWNNPYHTLDGVSRGYRFNYSSTSYEELYNLPYDVTNYELAVNFSYPISEYQSFGLDIAIAQVELFVSGAAIARSTWEFLNDNDLLVPSGDSGFFVPEVTFETWRTRWFWNRSTLNRGLFPTRGTQNSLSLDIALPGADLTYYTLNYSFNFVTPISADERFVFGFKSRFATVNSYDDTVGTPFFARLYSGGARTIRGFRNSTLVSRVDWTCNSTVNFETACAEVNTIPSRRSLEGGDLVVEGALEVQMPVPGSSSNVQAQTRARTVAFIDFGGAYQRTCEEWRTTCLELKARNLRISTGIALQWYTAVGPLNFILARDIQSAPWDETERFEFTLGGYF